MSRSLQQNVIDETYQQVEKETWEHMFIQIDNILNTYSELLIRLKKSWTNKVQLTLFISNKMFL